MEELKLSDDVIEQIKDFNHEKLTEEQTLLIDELILKEGLKVRYENYGLCKECKQPNTGRSYYSNDHSDYWCQSCNAKRFHQNFKNWASGNCDIDEFIQNAQLKAKFREGAIEWIEYDRFENVEYLARGGFGITYRAIWKDGAKERWDSEKNQWIISKNAEVALKYLHNSQDITVEFLREIESHIIMNNSPFVVCCYGISKDSETNNFIMVMEYAKYGNLRQSLNNNFNLLNWSEKLNILLNVAHGLYNIHDKKLIHHDFHCGNILNKYTGGTLIADLGLCLPANAKPSQSGNKKIYGVLPYVAPEVLRRKEYTQGSDIYGFGIIAYEICTGMPPYYDMAHEELLAIRICYGLRPKSNYKIPQLILDIIKQCWDADPLKRPRAEGLKNLFYNLHYDAENNENSLINKQIKESDEINEQLSSSTETSLLSASLSYTTHSQAIYTSRLLDFKNLPEPKNDDNTFETEYSESTAIDFTKIKY